MEGMVNTGKLKTVVIVLLLMTGALLSWSGYLENAVSAAGGEKVTEFNKAYLDKSFDKSLKGFLILSGIKSGLAIIEGSEIGVGFNLEIGDIVQSVYDYVDIAWRAALTGGTVILVSQLALQIIEMLNHWCLALCFLLILTLYLLTVAGKGESRFFSVIKSGLVFMSVLTIALYLILPVSIRSAALVSDKITNPLIEEAHQGFTSVTKELSAEALTSRLFTDNQGGNESWMDKLNPEVQYEKAKVKLVKLGLYLKRQAEFIAVWTIKLIAGYLFDCLLFPIIFFSFLYLFVKFTVHNLLGMRIFLNR